MTELERSETVSWLMLERYALGEVSATEAALVERALASDPSTRECLELISRPVRLKPLPSAEKLRSNVRPLLRLKRIARSPLTAVVAAAAAVALYVFVQSSEEEGAFAPMRIRTKGGEVALQLVRNRAGAVSMAPLTFAQGDRFKVLVTCPPEAIDRVRAVVAQGKERFSPLGPAGPITCGNAVPLPGAFSLSGTEHAVVCVAWNDNADRALESVSLRDSAVCSRLTPER